MLPPQLQDHERIRAQLNAALTAMNMAMEGQRLPPVYAAPQQQPVQAPLPDQPPLPAEDPLAGSRWASGVHLQEACIRAGPPGAGGRQRVSVCGACRFLATGRSKCMPFVTVLSVPAEGASSIRSGSAKDPVPCAQVCHGKWHCAQQHQPSCQARRAVLAACACPVCQ